jgi:hypothetical protein
MVRIVLVESRSFGLTDWRVSPKKRPYFLKRWRENNLTCYNSRKLLEFLGVVPLYA